MAKSISDSIYPQMDIPDTPMMLVYAGPGIPQRSLRSISIAFENAIAQARKLENSAQQMRMSKRQLTDIRYSLGSEWQGESATLYFQKCETLENKLEKTADDLMQIASVIRKSAKAYRDAELRALEAISKKNG